MEWAMKLVREDCYIYNQQLKAVSDLGVRLPCVRLLVSQLGRCSRQAFHAENAWGAAGT